MQLISLFRLIFISCVVQVTGTRTCRSCNSGGTDQYQPAAAISLYHLPVLGATAENQSVKLVLATTWQHTASSIQAHLLHTTSSDRHMITQECSNSTCIQKKWQQHQQWQESAVRSIGNNGKLLMLEVKRGRLHPFSNSVLQISSLTPLVMSIVFLGSCSSIYPIPYYALGVFYEVITWSPVGQLSSSAQASFTVVSQLTSDAPTVVYVRFPPASNGTSDVTTCDIRFGSVVHLRCGDVIRMTLLGSESATFFSSNVDLSGTIIEASERVAIYSANEGISIGPANGVIDSTSSQLFPVSNWGQIYAVAPIPDNAQSGYSVRITSGGLTGISITASINAVTTTYRLQPNVPLTLDVPDNSAAYITASAPAQVIQYVRGATVATDAGAPASLVLPACEFFDMVYQFIVDSTGTYINYVVIVISSTNRSDMLLNGAPLDPTGTLLWSAIGGNSGLVTTAFLLPVSSSIVTLQNVNAPFGAYRYSYIRGVCALAYPAGAKFFQPTSAVPPISMIQTRQATSIISSTSTPATSLLSSALSTTARSSTSTLTASSTPVISTAPLTTATSLTSTLTASSTPVISTAPLTTATSLTSTLTASSTPVISTAPLTTATSLTSTSAASFTQGASPTSTASSAPETSSASTAPITAAPLRPTEPINVGCAEDNMGTEFVLAFIQNVFDGATHHLQVYPASFSRSPSVNVTVELPVNSSVGVWNESFQLPTSMSLPPVVVEVPPEVELNGTGRSRKAVVVRATEPIGLYALSNTDIGSCDGFVALPVSSLGYVYYTISYRKTSYQSEFGIVAVEDGTAVQITLNPNANPNNAVEWQGITYYNYLNIPINITMDKYDTVQLQDFGDLAGTRIESNRPVAVFSGNNIAINGDESLVRPVHLVEQLPSVTDWGSTFYLVPLPDAVSSYTVRMVTSTADNLVTIQTSTVVLRDPGRVYTMMETSGRCVTVKSNATLLVAQFAGGTAETGHRAMQIIPPAERYRSWYTFSTQQGDELPNFTHYILVVINQSSSDGLLIDEIPLDRFNVSWMNFDAPAADMVGGAIRIKSGTHIIRQQNGVPFGAYVYGYSMTSRCSYAYPAGLCLRTPSEQMIPDSIIVPIV